MQPGQIAIKQFQQLLTACVSPPPPPAHLMVDQSVVLMWHKRARFMIHLSPVVSHLSCVERATTQAEPCSNNRQRCMLWACITMAMAETASSTKASDAGDSPSCHASPLCVLLWPSRLASLCMPVVLQALCLLLPCLVNDKRRVVNAISQLQPHICPGVRRPRTQQCHGDRYHHHQRQLEGFPGPPVHPLAREHGSGESTPLKAQLSCCC